MSGRFARVLRGEPGGAPPIWLMRQAGRYQQSYRRMREAHSFEDLCVRPELSSQVALAAVREFDFDAAILFSDLLFPLQALGMALSYEHGGPELDGPVTAERVSRFRSVDDAAARLRFQAEAVAATRAVLSPDKGLIGFVGGPWTLFVYAVEGSHAGALARAKSSPGLYTDFAGILTSLLERAIDMQLAAGADIVMVFDTAAGELSPDEFARWTAPHLSRLAAARPRQLGYFAKGLHPDQMSRAGLADMPWAGLGYDTRWAIAPLLAQPAREAIPPFVQGNFDPALLFLPAGELSEAIRRYLEPIQALDDRARSRWICGLGHGVLPGTPEANVATYVRMVREAVQ